MERQSKYSAEVRERAVRLVFEQLSAHESEWAAISSIAGKMGCTAETLRRWVRQAERDDGKRGGDVPRLAQTRQTPRRLTPSDVRLLDAAVRGDDEASSRPVGRFGALLDRCVYTIVAESALEAAWRGGGRLDFVEGKPWVRAAEWLREAQSKGRRLPIVLAFAEQTQLLRYVGIVEGIAVREDRTTSVAVVELRRLSQPVKKDTLRRFPKRERLDPLFIRPYALCYTPPLVDDAKLLESPGSKTATNDDDYLNDDDRRRKVLAERVLRDGQPEFRRAVLDAYGRRCAITGCDVPEVLDAAHIAAYSGPQSNVVQNGIALRSDIHALFDAGLLVVTDDFTVKLSPAIRGGSYRDLDGCQLRLPAEPAARPSVEALRRRGGGS